MVNLRLLKEKIPKTGIMFYECGSLQPDLSAVHFYFFLKIKIAGTEGGSAAQIICDPLQNPN